MSHTIEDFLSYEVNEMHKNIDRMKHGLRDENPDNPSLIGQYAMLEIQEAHLKFVEELSKRATSFEAAIDLCREQVIQHEMSHMQIALQENHQTLLHSEKWWYSLHQAQFYIDFLNRIKAWREAHV